MKLLRAGSPGMLKALSDPSVHTIVDILLQHLDILSFVADILQTHEQTNSKGLEEDLHFLYINQSRPKTAAKVNAKDTLTQIIELNQAILRMYSQRYDDLKYSRGAIVELITYKLIYPRYRKDECLNNHKLADEQSKPITGQLDVVALSHSKEQAEAYECKLKIKSLESEDCDNLRVFSEAVEEREYDVCVGAVSFDDNAYMERMLKWHKAPSFIQAYGLDNIEELGKTPF